MQIDDLMNKVADSALNSAIFALVMKSSITVGIVVLVSAMGYLFLFG